MSVVFDKGERGDGWKNVVAAHYDGGVSAYIRS